MVWLRHGDIHGGGDEQPTGHGLSTTAGTENYIVICSAPGFIEQADEYYSNDLK
jgi:hypothetical protein